MISLLSVEFGYNSTPIFTKLTLEFHKNRLNIIVGPNGSGKSSLVKLISGVNCPSFGKVLIGHSNLLEIPRKDRAKIISYLPQEVSVPENTTVEEIVALGRFPYKKWLEPLNQIDFEIIESSLREVNSEHFLGRTFGSLSGGEAQNVLLAAVLAQRTKVIILDEPGKALDVHHQSHLFRKLKRLSRHGNTVICVTHQLNMATQFGDIVFLLKDGDLMSSGSPADVITQNNLEMSYGSGVKILKDPSTNNPLVFPEVLG